MCSISIQRGDWGKHDRNQWPNSIHQCRLALRTARFEKELQDVFGKTTQIWGTEETRVKRVEQLFLQFENENLRLQLDQANFKLSKALRAESDTRYQFQATCAELDHLRSASRIASSEIEGLQVCNPAISPFLK